MPSIHRLTRSSPNAPFFGHPTKPTSWMAGIVWLSNWRAGFLLYFFFLYHQSLNNSLKECRYKCQTSQKEPRMQGNLDLVGQDCRVRPVKTLDIYFFPELRKFSNKCSSSYSRIFWLIKEWHTCSHSRSLIFYSDLSWIWPSVGVFFFDVFYSHFLTVFLSPLFLNERFDRYFDRL